jgi:hypothetical protein
MPEPSGFDGLCVLLRGDGDGRVDVRDEDPWLISDRATLYVGTGEERSPTSDCPDREVIVRFRRGRKVASCSLSDSPSSEDSSEVVILVANESGAVELRAGGLRVGGLLGRGGRAGDPALVADGGATKTERLGFPT